MIMTKEALKESYVLYNENIQDSSIDSELVGIFAIISIVIILIAFLIIRRTFNVFDIFLTIFISILAVGVFSIAMGGMLRDEEERELQYKINTIMPYLFKNAETSSTLKRYDKLDIQIDQEELLNTGAIMGQVVVHDNKNDNVYPFKQITLGVTSAADSYMEVNKLDVALSEEYPLGKAFNVLYLNNEDYTMFMNLFGEIPIRIEK